MNSFNSVAIFLAVFLTVALNTESKLIALAKFYGSTNRGHRLGGHVLKLYMFLALIYIRDIVMAFLLQYSPYNFLKNYSSHYYFWIKKLKGFKDNFAVSSILSSLLSSWKLP